MLRFKKFGFLLLLLPLFAKADNLPKNNYYPFLKQGFNISSYQKCRTLIRKCPLEGVFPALSCVNKIVGENRVCAQFAKVVDIVSADLTTLLAKQVKGFTLFDVLYTADGQHEYYILSKGHLINTNSDPRSLSDVFAKQYKTTSLFIVNWGEPKYHVNPDGSQHFTTVLKITEGCLACPIIGWATLAFNFTKKGNFLSIKLIHFKPNSLP